MMYLASRTRLSACTHPPATPTLLCRSARATALLTLALWTVAHAASAAAPAITNQPATQTIFYADPVTFRVGASGTLPLRYQWYRNGSSIASATTNVYTLAAVGSNDTGVGFSVIVTNTSGAATSTVATLTVDFGLTGPFQTNHLLSFDNTWKFNQTGTNIGASWMLSNYNDTVAGWLSGPGAFDDKWSGTNETPRATIAGLNVGTQINMKPFATNAASFYFRTHFTFHPWQNSQVVDARLKASAVIDDGAVFYLNGKEAWRVGVSNTAWNSYASRTAGDPVIEYFDLPVTNLVDGDNVLAVQLQQANSGSSDITFALDLGTAVYPRLHDTNAPTVVDLLPPPGVVASFAQLEVHFSEGVQNVQATNLLVNGLPAAGVIQSAPDVYIFNFTQPPVGPIIVSWNVPQHITDLSASSNTFAGGSYNYTLDPSALVSAVRINEFMAGNTHTIIDDSGITSDWIELFNSGNNPVDISHWYLTDNSTKLTKWQFPTGITLPAKAYLLVWASGNDHTNPAAPLHTSFRLSKNPGSFLGLVYSDGLTIVSSFANYPVQFDDVSYGRDRLDPSIVGYFTNATPGAANATVGANFAPPVTFSRVSGTFQQSFPVVLSCADPTATIRYYVVNNATTAAATNVPNSSSPIYTAPLTISSSVQVRARAFPAQTNFFPSAPTSETYLQLTAGAAAFSAPNPIFIFHNFGAGTPPATADQVGVLMVFGNELGRASLTNPPSLVARMGFNIRGRSTQGNPQSSYAVETWDEFNEPNKVEVLGFPSQSDWVFYAVDFFDKPLIHNPFMHELSRRIGRYSSRVRMVEAFTSFGTGAINYTTPVVGNYNGVYVLEEKIKVDPSRVDITKIAPAETNLDNITGGYMLKNDSANPGERTLYAGGQGMVYVEPKMDDYAAFPARALQENYIATYFNNFYNVLFTGNWNDPVTGYPAYIDPASWIDHSILEVLSRNADALRLSAFYYKDRGKRIEMGPLWDFDRSLGTSAGSDWRAWNPRSWVGSDPLGSAGSTDYGTDYFNPCAVFSNPWYSQLFYDPDFWQLWIDRWQSLRHDAFSTNSLFGIIDMFVGQVADAQPRAATRWYGSGASDTTPRAGLVSVPSGWPDTSYTYTFPGTYQGEIDFMKQWLVDRLEFIDTNFLAQPVLSSSGGPISPGFSLIITAPAADPGSLTFYTLDGSDPRLPGGDISPSALWTTAPINLTLTNNVRVVARNWNSAHQNLTGSANPPLSSPWSGPAAATFVISTPALAITELMYHPADPTSGTNTAGDFEFIELKNVGSKSIYLPGFRFTNGLHFTFSTTNAITNLAAGQYLVLVKNLAAFHSRYPTVTNVAGQYAESLSNGGEHLYLEGPLGEPLFDFSFHDSWYPTTDGQGFSLVIRNENASFDTWTNSSSWRASTLLGGSPGRADPAPSDIPAIVINEALTHTDLPELDALELYNPTALPVPIGGWFLSDDHQQPLKFYIPTNTTIPALGYVVFDASQFNAGSNAFNLSSLGEEVYLFSGDGTNLTGYRHGFNFEAQHNGVTFGRYVTSDGKEHFVTQKASTLGSANAGPKVGPIVISELMYSPPVLGLDTDNLDEYVELRNFSGQTVPLYDPLHTTNAWLLDGGIQFNFPLGVTMAPWSHLLLVNFDPARDPVSLQYFRLRYGLSTNTPLFGPYSGNLSNGGERVGLYEPDKPQVPPSLNVGFVPYVLVEEVHYSPLAPWPAGTDATSNSLQRISCLAFGDDPANWVAAAPTPGAINPASLLADTDHDGLPDEWEIANGLDPLDPNGPNGASGDPDGDGMTNLQEYFADTSPTNSTDYLHFDHVAITGANCLLQFTPKLGRNYSIEYVPSLSASNSWAALQSNLSGTNQLSIFDPLTPTSRCYRLKVTVSP